MRSSRHVNALDEVIILDHLRAHQDKNRPDVNQVLVTLNLHHLTENQRQWQEFTSCENYDITDYFCMTHTDHSILRHLFHCAGSYVNMQHVECVNVASGGMSAGCSRSNYSQVQHNKPTTLQVQCDILCCSDFVGLVLNNYQSTFLFAIS